MPITAACGCGKKYQVKDELAGKSVKCPACTATFLIPASHSIVRADPIFDRDKFLLREKVVSFSAEYFIGNANGKQIAFVHRPVFIGRLALIVILIYLWIMLVIAGVVFFALFMLSSRNPGVSLLTVFCSPFLAIAGGCGILNLLTPLRHVTFFRDQRMTQKLLTVRQDVRFSLTDTRYTLLDAAGEPLVRFRKNMFYNFIRRRWCVEKPDGSPFCMALEDSAVLALLRRFLGPLLGLLRTNYIITTGDGRHVLGKFNRELTLFDKYVLDLTKDPDRTLDRRVALALGVMLDTG